MLGAFIASFMTVTMPAWAAGTTVDVSLWDKGADAMSMDGPKHMLGMKDPNRDKETMGINESVSTVPAGEVTFEVTNDSKDTIHEMIVAPVQDLNKPLPYDQKTEAVDEEAAGSLGEVSELDPGKGGALRLTLDPGTYILYCNVPGHYAAGMWTLLTVKS